MEDKLAEQELNDEPNGRAKNEGFKGVRGD
jgi:hypothetical protein